MKLLLIVIFVCFAIIFSYASIFSSSTDSNLSGDEMSLKEKFTDNLQNRGIPPDLIVILVSMLPIFELRGGIPVGLLTLDLPCWRVYLDALLGNMIPVLPILIFTGALSRFLSKNKKIGSLIHWWFSKTKKKSRSIEKYKSLGLMLFVAIPLPVTGAWTGAFAAFLAGLDVRKSFLAILFGVAAAGVIVTAVTLLLSRIGWIGAVILSVIVLSAMGFSFYSLIAKDENRTRPSRRNN